MKKHAYLIIAHNEFNLLAKLLQALDDERADIYLHIDKKVKKVPFEFLKNSVKFSSLTFIKRMRVAWGGDTQVKCEMALLEQACKKEYEYIHLLSGVDFPLKSQDEINQFFDEHKGQEFIRFDKELSQTQLIVEQRVKYYALFKNITGRSERFFSRLLGLASCIFIALQKKLKIDRTKKQSVFGYKGDQWFSITYPCARFVVSKKKYIKKHYSKTICADEMFLHNIIMDSPFKNNVANKIMRLIDWNRCENGSPYTFKEKDYELLTSSEELFARKFSYSLYPEIIDKLEDNLNKKLK